MRDYQKKYKKVDFQSKKSDKLKKIRNNSSLLIMEKETVIVQMNSRSLWDNKCYPLYIFIAQAIKSG